MMLSYYFLCNVNDIQGFVVIGMGVMQKDSDVNSVISLKVINILVFDFYGLDDFLGVFEMVEF